MADFALLECPNLISRKFLMIEKFCNFYAVLWDTLGQKRKKFRTVAGFEPTTFRSKVEPFTTELPRVENTAFCLEVTSSEAIDKEAWLNRSIVQVWPHYNILGSFYSFFTHFHEKIILCIDLRMLWFVKQICD